MIDLFQFCDKCNTERNFDPNTWKCKKCNCQNRSHEKNSQSVVQKHGSRKGL